MLKNFRSQLFGAFIAAVLAAGLTVFATSTINTANPVSGQPYNATPIRNNFQAAANDANTLMTLNAGASAPVTCNLANLGTVWLNNAASPYTLSYCDGTGTWLAAGYWDVTNHIIVPLTGRGTQQSIIAATTTDLGSVPQSSILVTGGTTITSLGSSAKAGDLKVVQFAGVNTLTYNATSLILPGGVNITTAANDIAIFESLGSGNWVAAVYSAASSGVGFVRSFNGRCCVVLPQTGDYSFSQISGAATAAQLPVTSPPGVSIGLAAVLNSPATSVAVSADEIVVATALNGTAYTLPSYSQVFNAGTVGPGGMDTGALPSSGNVCIYAIYKPTTDTKSILGTSCATSATTIYGGANLPAGYTASALMGYWPTNSSPAMIAGNIRGPQTGFVCAPQITYLITGSGTFTTPTCQGNMPLYLDILMAGGGAGGSGNANGNVGGGGSNTTFSSLGAGGGTHGPGGGGTASGGDINYEGSGGQGGIASASDTRTGMPGGCPTFIGGMTPGVNGGTGVAGSPNTGCGGAGGAGGAGQQASEGGGSGGSLRSRLFQPAASYSYSVGAGGTAGASGGNGFAGGVGGAGIIIINAAWQ